MADQELQIQHPKPGLLGTSCSDTGSIHSIDRLELSAARLSVSGSDLEDEIRKLNEDPRPLLPTAASSILDTNRAARTGAYSPHGFVASPVGSPDSVRSMSWSRMSSLNGRVVRKQSLPEPEQEGRPLDSPLTQEPLQAFTSGDDDHTIQEDRETLDRLVSQPARTISNASTNTLQKAKTTFRDFDGAHFADIDEESETDQLGELKSTSQLSGKYRYTVAPGTNIQRWSEPPPPDGMIYYPAPVPMTLNLPKRLSHKAPATLDAVRRSRVLESISSDARKSAPWLSSDDLREPSPQRHKKQSSRNLPPQLRASVFFDHTPVPQKLDIKRGSAVLTLEHLLNESARVPTLTGQDEPLDMPDEVIEPVSDHAGRRSIRQSMLSFGKRSSKPNLLETETETSVSNHDQVSEQAGRDQVVTDQLSNALSHNKSLTPLQALKGTDSVTIDGSVPVPHPVVEDAIQEEGPSEAELQAMMLQQFGPNPPTTLMAELQLRKQQLRSRNRTAADAFPNGARSTLLQLDAVAQVENQRRRVKRTALAWEEPTTTTKAEPDDDDVPLAMLYPSNNKPRADATMADWDRPLGLLEKRQMEDSEPLSSRRNRLKGLAHNYPTPSRESLIPRYAHQYDEDETSEHGDETLAQRHRRLRSSLLLDNAINGGPVNGHRRNISGEFVNEMMGQIGRTPSPQDDGAEETLGQRRRRLQAASKPLSSKHHELRSTRSLANLLSSHPIGDTRPAYDQRVMSQGTAGLLGLEEQKRQQHQQQLHQQSFGQVHSNLYLSNQPSAPMFVDRTPSRGLLASHNSSQRFNAASMGFNNSGYWGQQSRQVSGASSSSQPHVHAPPGYYQQQALHQQQAAWAGDMASAAHLTTSQRATIDQWRMSVAQ